MTRAGAIEIILAVTYVVLIACAVYFTRPKYAEKIRAKNIERMWEERDQP